MNKIDIENIKKELAKRKAANYDWKDGGEMTKDDVMLRTTKELNDLLNDYTNLKQINTETEIKKLADEIFAEFGDEEDNMIILGGGNYYNDCRDFNEYSIDELLKRIDFNDEQYNPHAHPVGRNLNITYYNHTGDKEDDKKFDKLIKKSEELANKLSNLPIKSINDYGSDNNDPLNEMWCGCHAITRDYKIYAFVIRDDGLFLNASAGFESFWNHVLYTIK